MLKNELEIAKRAVTTDSLQISIGEIASMYSQGELDIIPEFQRLFRWSLKKKTAFIESILIGIPIPPAFAYETGAGTWELIDGLQRISTILEFMGILKSPEDRNVFLPPSTLMSSTYLPSLEGISWTGSAETGVGSLDKTLQLFFRRARLDFQVLKHPSDARTKFDLFKRLNRGGEYANEQEVRTCSMVLVNPDATRTIREIAQSNSFTQIMKISHDNKKNQRDIELLVRAIVHISQNFDNSVDVQEFLDRGILRVLTEPNTEQPIRDAEWASNILFERLNSDALIPHDQAYEGIARRFSLRALEAIFVGVAKNRRAIELLQNPGQFVEDRIDAFWREQAVVSLSDSGLRGTTRILRTVPFGQNWFDPNA